MKDPKFKIGDVVNTKSGGSGIVCAILDSSDIINNVIDNTKLAKSAADLMDEILDDCDWFCPMYHIVWRDEEDNWMVSTVDEKELTLNTTKTMMVNKSPEFLERLTALGKEIKNPTEDDNEDQSK